jgi:hypothetical protein
MFNAPPREKEWVSWFCVVAWSLVIFVTIPFARALQEGIAARWGREVFTYGVIAGLVAAAVAAMVGLLRARRQVGVAGYLWLGAVAALTIYSAGHMNISPEEAVHFLEYGLLGILLFRALSHRLRDAGIYAVAVLVGSLVGTADEIIQWIVPRRFFAFSDIWLNAYAVILAQVALAKGLKPPFISRRVEPPSVRAACALAAGLIIVLALCASNTPRVFEWYTRFPRLEFLHKTAGVMTEYGFRYDDAQSGTFFSRMSLKQLREQDERRCAEAAAILDEYASPNDYGTFLRRYTSTRDPFVHEARVHLFRRDHYMAVAWKYENDPVKYRFHNTVAYRENQILEKYFGETLRRSSCAWAPEQAAAIEKKMDPSLRYKSEVSADLLTGFTERQMWAAVLLALIVLGVVRRYYGERKA